MAILRKPRQSPPEWANQCHLLQPFASLCIWLLGPDWKGEVTFTSFGDEWTSYHPCHPFHKRHSFRIIGRPRWRNGASISASPSAAKRILPWDWNGGSVTYIAQAEHITLGVIVTQNQAPRENDSRNWFIENPILASTLAEGWRRTSPQGPWRGHWVQLSFAV